MKTALIIHGAYGNPNENWIPWLKSELEKFGYEVAVPVFPTPENQNIESWLDVVSPHFENLNNESVLVGHSIGAVFLLSILEKLNTSVKTTIFASGFLHDLGNDDFDKINRTFYDKDFDWQKIKKSSQEVFVFHGDNDPYVPLSEAENLAEKLCAETEVIKNGGHLNESAGFVEFPALLETIITFDNRKSLIVPINSKRQIFIQDRRGHKKPDWGYFGGEIEEGETPTEAVIRETKEELDIDIKPNELKYLGTSTTLWDNHKIMRYMHLYRTEQESFNVLEGKGGHWLSFEEVRERLDDKDRFDEIAERIDSALTK